LDLVVAELHSRPILGIKGIAKGSGQLGPAAFGRKEDGKGGIKGDYGSLGGGVIPQFRHQGSGGGLDVGDRHPKGEGMHKGQIIQNTGVKLTVEATAVRRCRCFPGGLKRHGGWKQ
jgi:hypothetical protein